jgi:UDP-N-acetylglucosamine 2-epimerase (non-hydrolysing)/GDP/UDP-N,N'-diacetylbacillosamine 2-epimerase (hydrolysing)
MPKRKICVVTGSRAEYGLLKGLMGEIRADSELELQLVATGMHLSPEFGLTYRKIEEDGFAIDEKVEMLLSSDTAVGIAKSIGLGVIGFAETLSRLRPDMVVLLGDRYEIFAAAQAALVAKVPVAHIAGGDTTEGAIDEAIRHSITKMSHLHFVTHAEAHRRVRQLGEDPARIFTVGSPALDELKGTKLLDRGDLESALAFRLRPKNLLVTFHPETLAQQSPEIPFGALLSALEELGEDVGLIFTRPNADTDGRRLIGMIGAFTARHPQATCRDSLGQLLYWSTLAQVDAVVGNSSSGLYEAPSFGKPTVNVGDRQKGRLRASSVIDCAPEKESIMKALRQAFLLDCTATVNPYGDGNSVARIIAVLKGIDDPRALVRKHFFILDESHGG